MWLSERSGQDASKEQSPGFKFPTNLAGAILFPFHPESLPKSRSAQILSRYRPRALIIAVTRDQQVARQAHLSRGVFPVVCHGAKQETWAEDVDRRVQFGIEMGEFLEFEFLRKFLGRLSILGLVDIPLVGPLLG